MNEKIILGEGTYVMDAFARHLLPMFQSLTDAIIVECGAYKGFDAIDLYTHYHPKMVFTIECNPESIPVCINNITAFNARFVKPADFDITATAKIRLLQTAVGASNGDVVFYMTDMKKSVDKNIGASSMLLHRDNKVDFFQKRCVVPITRLDFVMQLHQIKKIHLLCMDIQGYETQAIIGLGDRIKDVAWIISELSPKSFYYGDVLVQDFIDFLSVQGFEMIERSGDNALFKNRTYNEKT